MASLFNDVWPPIIQKNREREREILSVYPDKMSKCIEPIALNVMISIYVYSGLQGCVHSRNPVYSQCVKNGLSDLTKVKSQDQYRNNIGSDHQGKALKELL